MKKLEELVDVAAPCWNEIEDLLHNASNKVLVLSRNEEQAKQALADIQQGLDTWLGALIYHTGGILINDGWIRILGSGCERMKRSIPSWNKGKTYDSIDEPLPYLLVADDVLGGLFAINNGGLGENPGAIYYFAPDLLEWEDLEISYDQFIWFCFNDNIADFYGDLCWKGWEKDVVQLSADEAYYTTPQQWDEKFTSIEQADKTAVSMEELFSIQMELAEELDEQD